jgi:hypothetical protein
MIMPRFCGLVIPSSASNRLGEISTQITESGAQDVYGHALILPAIPGDARQLLAAVHFDRHAQLPGKVFDFADDSGVPVTVGEVHGVAHQRFILQGFQHRLPAVDGQYFIEKRFFFGVIG